MLISHIRTPILRSSQYIKCSCVKFSYHTNLSLNCPPFLLACNQSDESLARIETAAFIMIQRPLRSVSCLLTSLICQHHLERATMGILIVPTSSRIDYSLIDTESGALSEPLCSPAGTLFSYPLAGPQGSV